MSKKLIMYRRFLTACMLSFFVCVLICPEVILASEAAKQEVMGKFYTFETFLADIISTLGSIYTLWGISEWGFAWHESNGTMGGQSFKRIFGGVVVTMSPQILLIIK